MDLPRPDEGLRPLRDAFLARGADAAICAWDDPSVRWTEFDVALLQSTWNYVRRLYDFLPWLERTAAETRLLNPLPTVRWNIHKRYLLALAEVGIPTVPTMLVPARGNVELGDAFARWGDLVLKPAISAGSFATVRVSRGDHAAARAHLEEHRERDMLVQPLLARVLREGERNLVHLGGALSHTVAKGARWSGQSEASRECVSAAADERDLAARTLAALASFGLEPPTYARVDLARDDAGRPLLMEVELIEPSLFLHRDRDAADRLARAVLHATAE
jgi:glutathione synthase/RimK-type ligase-like ATP-grasp enzyme